MDRRRRGRREIERSLCSVMQSARFEPQRRSCTRAAGPSGFQPLHEVNARRNDRPVVGAAVPSKRRLRAGADAPESERTRRPERSTTTACGKRRGRRVAGDGASEVERDRGAIPADGTDSGMIPRPARRPGTGAKAARARFVEPFGETGDWWSESEGRDSRSCRMYGRARTRRGSGRPRRRSHAVDRDGSRLRRSARREVLEDPGTPPRRACLPARASLWKRWPISCAVVECTCSGATSRIPGER